MSNCVECRHASSSPTEVRPTAKQLLSAYEKSKATAQSMYEYHRARRSFLQWRLRALENRLDPRHWSQARDQSDSYEDSIGAE